MRLSSLNPQGIAGKKVLVRVDLNLPLTAQGKIADKNRIEAILPTLQFLVDHGAIVGVLAHWGKPLLPAAFCPKTSVPPLSLAPMVPLLQSLVSFPVIFSPHTIGSEAKTVLHQALPGTVVILENLRFHPGEETNDPTFAKALASLGDLYVNEAFSCAHRPHASIVGIPCHLPSKVGIHFEQEMTQLRPLLKKSQGPSMALIGGSKISTKLPLLRNLLKTCSTIGIGGGMAHPFLAAQGISVGASIQEPLMIQEAGDFLKEAQAAGCPLLLPLDGIVQESPDAPVDIRHVPSSGVLVDMGPRSLAQLNDQLSRCETVIWNGPMGLYEIPPFDQGSLRVAQMIATHTNKGHLKSFVGGGDTLAVLKKASVQGKITHLSTGGGAFLRYLETGSLPGWDAIVGCY